MSTGQTFLVTLAIALGVMSTVVSVRAQTVPEDVRTRVSNDPESWQSHHSMPSNNSAKATEATR